MLVPDESKPEASIVSATLHNGSSAADENWLLAVGIVMVGIAGYRDEKVKWGGFPSDARSGLKCCWDWARINRGDDLDFDSWDDGPRDFATSAQIPQVR